MKDYIIYNKRKYFKHPKQKYYYVGRMGKNYSRCLHRQIWFDIHGPIPKGYQVHHKNGDAFDNRIENMELVEHRAHIKSHMKKRAAENPQYFVEFQKKGIKVAPQWHKSPEGIEWHRQNAIKCGFGHKEYGLKPCEYCGKEFIRKNTTGKFCNSKCKSKYKEINYIQYEIANCEKCGTEFKKRKWVKKRFCSLACRPTPNPYGMNGKPENNAL